MNDDADNEESVKCGSTMREREADNAITRALHRYMRSTTLSFLVLQRNTSSLYIKWDAVINTTNSIFRECWDGSGGGGDGEPVMVGVHKVIASGRLWRPRTTSGEEAGARAEVQEKQNAVLLVMYHVELNSHADHPPCTHHLCSQLESLYLYRKVFCCCRRPLHIS